MCDYILGVVPREAELVRCRAIARAAHRNFEPVANAHLLAQLDPGDRLFYVGSRSTCDCGTALGLLYKGGHGPRSDDIERQAARLRKRGWSEAKVARWRYSKQVAATPDLAEEERTLRVHEPMIDTWVDLLNEMLASSTPRFGLLVHWGNGGCDRFEIEERREFSMRFLQRRSLLEMPHDTLFSFFR